MLLWAALPHRDKHVDAAFVAERNAPACADEDDRKFGAMAKRFANADRRVMPSGFACRAHRENQAALERETVDGGFSAASAAANDPFCSDTPRPRMYAPAAFSISSPANGLRMRAAGWVMA